MINKQVYPNYRLDKNISWYNIITFVFGLIYGIFTLEFLKKKDKYMIPRLKTGKLWLPPIYAKE